MISHGLSQAWPPSPPGSLAHLRPALASTGLHARLFIQSELGPSASARPGPNAPLAAPLTFPAHLALRSQARLLRATPPPGVFPVSQPLGARFRLACASTFRSAESPRPVAARAHLGECVPLTQEVGWLRDAPPRAWRLRWTSIQSSAE